MKNRQSIAPMQTPFPDDNEVLANHVQRLLASYHHWFGHSLIEPGATASATAQRLWDAPFAVLSHDTAPAPLFNYANRAGLALFEMDWPQLLATPSRASAEAVTQEERDQLLARVSSQGYIGDYSGVRISRSGRRFRIENAKVWNLLDGDGCYAGQAALISQWQYL